MKLFRLPQRFTTTTQLRISFPSRQLSICHPRSFTPGYHHPSHQPSIYQHFSSTGPNTLKQQSNPHSLQPFLLADIGEGITGCEIVKWLVKPGQTVAEFDPIAEVQSDKATVEITSPYDGIIESLVGQTGQVVKVGEPLCMILVEADPQSPTTPESSKEQEKEQFDVLVDTSQQQINEQAQPIAHHQQSGRKEPVHSTPSVRRLAHGRVTKEDVINHLSRIDLSQVQTVKTLDKDTNQQPLNKTVGSLKNPFGAVRQAMFRGMTQSLRIPHFGYYDQIDVTELERVRQGLLKHDPNSRITLLSLFVKILGRAMIQNELFMSTLSTDEPPQFIKRQTCDISIAVSSPAGLLTPLIPSVDSKSIVQIANHITSLRDFINKSSPNKIPRIPDELGGNRSGTLTISNIGSIGGTYTHPVIPPTGQLAIGAIGAMKVRPEYSAGDKQLAKAFAIDPTSAPPRELKVEPRLVVEVSFTADHRAVEGVELARLVQCFKHYCQAPGLLFADLI
ncbi:hypothetical protein VP01_1782g1 [Puccinia sorghi]|uniref:Dihydrolipoamide acetyltransferase component of pyruvate dehydrogenase complex n=1 Tax=Puccinia sorghi TaxID=27349 RepID=A0A0L6VEQ3_9BASI|nr:hypothetical protein VP01_1782g1 [Puccinia sorghi]